MIASFGITVFVVTAIYVLMDKVLSILLEDDTDLGVEMINPVFACLTCMSSAWGLMSYVYLYDSKFMTFTYLGLIISISTAIAIESFSNAKYGISFYLLSLSTYILIKLDIAIFIWIMCLFLALSIVEAIRELYVSALAYYEQKSSEDLNRIAEELINKK